jgi:hypothetical protein
VVVEAAKAEMDVAATNLVATAVEASLAAKNMQQQQGSNR